MQVLGIEASGKEMVHPTNKNKNKTGMSSQTPTNPQPQTPSSFRNGDDQIMLSQAILEPPRARLVAHRAGLRSFDDAVGLADIAALGSRRGHVLLARQQGHAAVSPAGSLPHGVPAVHAALVGHCRVTDCVLGWGSWSVSASFVEPGLMVGIWAETRIRTLAGWHRARSGHSHVER